MWIEKLFAGVLRVLTPLGARYINPTLAQRIYLLWIFRHFNVLPLPVLTPPCVLSLASSRSGMPTDGSRRSWEPWSAARRSPPESSTPTPEFLTRSLLLRTIFRAPSGIPNAIVERR
jgi:hypothetical protein